ncbi:gamma-glutamylcyclotransferase family protein [Mucilaginibacter sp. cycad4]|uniref:gamma-glutamylcyclotransferase family protein n=1 Tax=Mucilaginibacter sp. cycad4 TaxID=3342096 RepID=UPI002AAB2D09|nr:gamma-glutamylcyclotransferase family protein [Mucilaginibacter gossypii]WPV00955.1 gamma-glutamylcyclotransferase family protein [Mucilaginibacter gossypii]
METTSQFLFVYGTLLQPGNEFAAYLNKHCKFIGDGKIRGRLYDIGEYPGAVIGSTEERYIYGSIFMMDDPEAILKVIDDYEGIGKLYHHPQEYIRQKVGIYTANDIINCWMYLYNLPVVAYHEVTTGDYIQYLKDTSAKNNVAK